MAPALVEPPRIERPTRKGASKYVDHEQIPAAASLVTQGWTGELIEPVDTIVKARIAARSWKVALAKHMQKETDAFAVRIYTPSDAKGKTLTGKFTFAIVLKEGA